MQTTQVISLYFEKSKFSNSGCLPMKSRNELQADTAPRTRWAPSEAIRSGATPIFTADDQVLVHRLVTELIVAQRLTDATFTEAIARFGEQGIVELGTIVGYYTAIGNALNAFQVPLPAGAPQPFPE
jgi:hypothetical protein